MQKRKTIDFSYRIHSIDRDTVCLFRSHWKIPIVCNSIDEKYPNLKYDDWTLLHWKRLDVDFVLLERKKSYIGRGKKTQNERKKTRKLCDLRSKYPNFEWNVVYENVELFC